LALLIVGRPGLTPCFERKAGLVVGPMHQPIKPGTLRGLIEQAGVTVEAFCAAL
jgi:hypothetical protein